MTIKIENVNGYWQINGKRYRKNNLTFLEIQCFNEFFKEQKQNYELSNI